MTPAVRKVAWFVSGARNALDGRLAAQGFSFACARRDIAVRWRRGDVFLDVSYLPESLPEYVILIDIGRGDGPVGAAQVSAVPAWKLVPPEARPAAGEWRFGSRTDLSKILDRVWDAVIAPHLIPLCENPAQLDALIAARRAELDACDRQRRDEERVARARLEFDAGRYANAVASYGEVSSAASLAAADRKRLEIARRRQVKPRPAG